MPMTLPMSRSRGRTVDRTTSTTRLCFSSTTPVRTVNPKLKMPTRMSTAPMLANRNCASSASVCGSSASTVGCLLGGKELFGRDARLGQHRLRSQARPPRRSRAGSRTGPAPRRNGSRRDRTGRPARSTTASTDSSASAASPAATSGNGTTSTSRSSWAAVVVIATVRPGGAGWTIPIFVASSSPNNSVGTTNEPTTSTVVNSDRQDEAATPAALDDLAPGDQPDAAPATHRATSSIGDGAGVTASMNSSDSFGG